MKHISRVFSVLLALLMLCSAGLAETGDSVVAMVNGEPLYYSDYYAIETAYIYQYELNGVDMSDNTVYTYVQDLALTYAIEQMLVVQDTKAQGFYELDAEVEAWCVEQGTAAYEQALADVGEMLRETLELDEDFDMTEYALAYAQSLNVTVETYIKEYRTQYAAAKYQEWLIRDNPVTDEQVQAEYDARVQASEALYAQDVAAFEKAMYTGAEIWYMPEGYRMIQLLTLAAEAEGDTDEAKLASVQARADEVVSRLAGGESFDSLIPLYSEDANPVTTAYQVHPESILYEAALTEGAFAPEMAAPGDCRLIVLGDAVVLLYYQADTTAGPVAMTEEIHDALAYLIYAQRTQTAQAARIDELADAAEVVIY